MTIAAQDFAEAHRKLLANRNIQFDLPREAPRPSDISEGVGLLAPLAQFLFWAALAAAMLFILYLIASRLAGWESRRKEKPGEEAQDLRPAEAPARRLLADADALAAEGRFSEAARLLLFRSIDDIDSRRPDLVGPALTSRDIAALPAIPDRPRSAFARIAAFVERSLFGARALGESDWRDCRAAYEEFAFAEAWRG